jgi:hypothetical protein
MHDSTGKFVSGTISMVSDHHYYQRRAMQEQVAARNALTEEGRERRLALAQMYREKLAALTA